jgi:hypothetical protein
MHTCLCAHLHIRIELNEDCKSPSNSVHDILTYMFTLHKDVHSTAADAHALALQPSMLAEPWSVQQRRALKLRADTRHYGMACVFVCMYAYDHAYT